MTPAADPPTPAAGCRPLAGLFLAAAAGTAGAFAAAAGSDAPFGVVALIFFGTPGLYLAALVLWAVRHARAAGTAADADPVQQTAARFVLPVVGAFAAASVLSVGGPLVALAFGAPWWVMPVLFMAPPALLVGLAWPYLKTLADRLKRAAPSPERAAARAAEPAVPVVPAVATAPGRTLAQRLPDAGNSAGCGCLAVLGVALFWNGIVGVFAWQAVAGFVNGRPEWFLVAFLVPFVLVGLGLVLAGVVAAGQWLVSLLAGAVTVEVDAHPFAPGGTYRGRVSQTGLFRLTKVGVELACSEAATYDAGTRQSTDTKVVARHPAAGPADPPFAFALAVPADAMHSFAAARNKIAWAVAVRGRVLGVLPYSRSFAVAVHPGGDDGE